MNDSQTHLHSENFDLCRICLLEPESNRGIKFFHVFSPNIDDLVLSVTITEFLGFVIDKDDVKPKIICENCHKSILGWVEMKKRAAESQIVINYIEKKRYGAVSRISSASGLSASPEAYQSSSNITDISVHSRNAIQESSNSYYSITRSKSSVSNNSKTTLSIQNNFCSSSSSSSNSNTNQNNHYQSTSINQSTISSIDDQTIESDDDTSCQVMNVNSAVICISDNESTDESVQNKIEYINNDEITKLNYCSICKKKKNYNHDCSQDNKEFSTCLIPNCNILSRSIKDFTPHYRQHMGIPVGGVLCRNCYKENKKSERDENGCHINCNTANVFKCYTCIINFNNMAEFAYHKLKTHNGRLINSLGNYLCFYCEKSSPDLMKINEHIKKCLKNQTETVPECNIKQKETEKKIIDETSVKNVNVHNKEKEKTIPRSSTHFLFTCLKPSCNLIFQNFAVFKLHHREHFSIGNDLMCWQCCSPFSNLNSLRAHQVKGNCRTPGMFKCFDCPEKYNDLQSLSIHKFITHNAELISNKNNKKTIKCAYCKNEIFIINLKAHLIKCQLKNEKKMISKPNPKLVKKVIKSGPFKCEFCCKVCLTAAALSSHIKIHSNLPKKRKMNKKNKYMKKKCHKLTYNSENEINISQSNGSIKSSNCIPVGTNNYRETDELVNTLPSTSQSNESIKYEYCDIANSSITSETDEENTTHSNSKSNGSIKSEYCDMANSSIIEESDEEINTLYSTTKSNGSIKSDDCDVDNSSITEEIDEKINTSHCTSKSNDSIKSGDCDVANLNLIKETDEKNNTLYSTSQNNGSIKSDDCNMTNSSITKKPNGKSCTTSLSTSLNDKFTKSGNCDVANSSINKEKDDEINMSHRPKNNEPTKSDDCNMTNSSITKEPDGKICSTLPSTSQNDKSIKSGDCDSGNSIIIEETEEEINTLHYTQNNGSIKSNDCNLTNSKITKETNEEINTLHSPSKSNESIKSDDCNVANSNIIKKTCEEINTLHNTQNNGSIKSGDCDITNSNINEEITTTSPSISQNNGFIKSDCSVSNITKIKEINLRSSTSEDNKIEKIFNHEMPTCVDELFSCSKCPKKFSSKRGLSLHRSLHSKVNKIPKHLVKNYYCTKCKEYFTCSGFGEHWKLSHGKKLKCQKSKQYSCHKCKYKFIYKMAFLMHKEHKHSDITINKTPLSSSIVLPVKTITTITTDKTSLDTSIMLPIIHNIHPIDAEESEDLMNTDQENCNEKSNMFSKAEKAELDNKMKQNNEVNECKNNLKQDFSNEKDNNSTDSTHDSIIQNTSQAKKTDGVRTDQFFEESLTTYNAIINKLNKENRLSTRSKTIEVEDKVTTVNKNEKNIN